LIDPLLFDGHLAAYNNLCITHAIKFSLKSPVCTTDVYFDFFSTQRSTP
jgi:hypothetical protein